MDSSAGRGWSARIPDVAWAPVTVGVLMVVVGATGVFAGQPWLFPSLGPTAFLQGEEPSHPSSRPYNVVAGHLIALGAALLIVALLGASHAPAVTSTGHLTMVRMWTAVLTMALTSFGLIVLRSKHTPAASTALLFALGSFSPTLRNAIALAVGVVIVAVVGEVFRRARLGKLG